MNYAEYISLNKRITILESILNESKQVGIIYHVCSLEAYLEYILPEDTLSSSGEWTNHLYKSSDYVSFTRNKGYIVPLHDADNVLIQLVVDGDKLSNDNYKIGPYNFYAFKKDGSKYKGTMDPKLYENEEAVKGPIKNISKYIKEIRIDFLSSTDDTSFAKVIKDNLNKLSNVKYYNFAGKSGINLKSDNGTLLKDVFPKIIQRFNSVNSLYSGNSNAIKKAIELGIDVNKKYGDNDYPITHYCDEPEDSAIVKKLLEAGANPNTVAFDGEPVIYKAAGCWAENTVKYLIKAGADINSVDSNGNTVLANAIKSGDDKMVKILVNAGADVNAKTKDGKLMLDLVYEPDVEIRQILIKAGAKGSSKEDKPITKKKKGKLYK